ncbi:LuxR C-terminal-related transcriptional regulator [Pseudoclavibacter terrae]|uniref:LuxR C-terminal-related transcriptional regulator n=1 Tax=Pseudoclavibacter terrae TaxID=1530195 RepID=UPI002330FBBF|nr:LuxR C-terminal-related transcriptional regulator [Pseudoclavibacter terrae]
MNPSAQQEPRSARLGALLDAASTSSVVVIRAPWGFGKANALREWQGEDGRPVVRIDIDDRNASRERFWQSVAADVDSPASAEPSHSGSSPIDALIEGIVSAAPVTLVISGFERLADQPEVEADLADLAALVALAPWHRVMIATRRVTGFEDVRTRMSMDVQVIAAEELLFTASEIDAELRRAGIADPAIATVVERVSGCVPALVKLSVLEASGRGQPVAVDVLERWLDQRLGEYVTESVLDGADDIAVRVLGADCLDEALAGQLTARPGAQVLDELERRGLGAREELVLEDGTSQSAFRFTPAIARAGRAWLRASAPAGFVEQRRSFAAWAKERGLSHVALTAAIDATDHALASSIIMDHWFELGDDRPQVVAALEGLPRLTIARWPLLGVELALCYLAMQDHQWKAAEVFALSLTGIGLRRGTATATEQLMYVLLEMVAARTVFGSYKQARHHAQRLTRMLAEFPPAEQEHARRVLPHAISQLAATQLFAGLTQDALQTLVSGTVTAASLHAPLRARYFPLSLRAGAHALAGELEEARQAIAESDSVPGQEHRHNDYSGSPARLAEAYVHLEAGRYGAALDVLARLHPHYRTIENIHLLLEAETWAHIGLDPAQGLDRILETRKQAERQRRLPSYVTAHLDRSTTHAALASHRIGLATQYSRGVDVLGRVPAATLRAKVDLARHSDTDALGLLLRFPPARETTLRDRLDYELALATAYQRTGHRDSAIVLLRSAAASLTNGGLTLPLLGHRSLGHADLASLADETGITLPHLTDGLAKPTEPHPAAPPNLTPREFAVLRELMDNASYAEVSARLDVSINTVRTQVRSLYGKLGVRSREEAIHTALTFHLLDDQ